MTQSCAARSPLSRRRPVTAGGRVEPRARRLAPVARAEARRRVRRARAAEGLAVRRTASWPGRRPAPARATRRFRRPNGRLYTLGARGGTEYVMAFDAASGKRLWEVAHGQRFSNDRGDGPRATPTIEGDRLYAFGASGDLQRDGRGHRQDPVAGQRAQAVRRLEHHVGTQRIAAGAERSHPRQRRRAGRLHRRAEEDRRIADLEEPAGRGRDTRRRCCRKSAACGRRSTSPASARSASTWTPASCCGATTRSPTTPPTSPRRSCAATACSCRPATARAPRCSR